MNSQNMSRSFLDCWRDLLQCIEQLWHQYFLCTGTKAALLSNNSLLRVSCCSAVPCHLDEPMRYIEAVRNSCEITDKIPVLATNSSIPQYCAPGPPTLSSCSTAHGASQRTFTPTKENHRAVWRRLRQVQNSRVGKRFEHALLIVSLV